MPITKYDFRPFNYGEAVSQGQQIKANALKLREGVRAEQGRNILSQASGLQGEAKYNFLKQSGQPELADVAQKEDMLRQEAKVKYLKSQLESVRDPQTYEAMIRNVEGSGLAPMGSTKARFGEYDQATIDKFLGRKTETKSDTQAQKKMEELIKMDIDPNVAQGIAYGTLKTQVDPTTGNVMIVDTRQFGKDTAGESPTVVAKGDKPQQKFEKKVEDFSKEVEKSGIVDVENAMVDVEESIKKITKDDKNADIPGFGVTAKLPDFMVSEEGKSLRQRVATLFNMTLKDRSGAAVTAPELQRLKSEFGQGLIKTDAQLLDALQRFRGVLDKHKLTLAAGYDDDVVDKWQKRSKMTLREVKEKNTVKRYKINPQTGKLEAK